jgi:hypothetical protein
MRYNSLEQRQLSRDRTILESFAIMTTSPNELMRRIHKGMLILNREDEEKWLNCSTNPFDKVQTPVKPFPPELLEALPRGRHPDFNQPWHAQGLGEVELAALQYLDVVSPNDIEMAFRAASKERADAVLALNSPVLNSHRTQVADLAVKNRLLAVYGQPEFMDAGGLMYYGASYTDLFRRAATYLDRILKGAKPAEQLVEQPKKFEFIINLKTAKQIGLTIPPNVPARADKVIK